MGQISIRGETHTRLKAYAEQEGRSMASITEEWVQMYAPFTDKLPPKLDGYNYNLNDTPVARKRRRLKKQAKVEPERKVEAKSEVKQPTPEPTEVKQPTPEPPKPKRKFDPAPVPEGLLPFRPKTPTGSGYGEF